MPSTSNDSLDTVEIVMVFEEVFGVVLPLDGTQRITTRDGTVDWLVTHLSNQRPNRQAAALLKRLAQSRQPELARDLNGPWRREQILAILGEILK
jgi:hypothetical protein